jgi:hypothetical protein
MHPRTLVLPVGALALFAAITGCAGDSTEEAEETDSAASEVAAGGSTDFVRKARRTIEPCFSHDWSKEGFRYEENPKYQPDQDWARWVGGTIAETFGKIFENVGYLVFKGTEGDRLLEDSIARLKKISAEQQLLPYQKTLAAQCVASELFEYGDSAIAKFFGSSAAAEYEAGVCTEFAQVAARLLNGIGVWARIYGAVREAHTWVEVYYPDVDGTSYFIEPQHNPKNNGNVKFYNRH